MPCLPTSQHTRPPAATPATTADDSPSGTAAAAHSRPPLSLNSTLIVAPCRIRHRRRSPLATSTTVRVVPGPAARAKPTGEGGGMGEAARLSASAGAASATDGAGTSRGRVPCAIKPALGDGATDGAAFAEAATSLETSEAAARWRRPSTSVAGPAFSAARAARRSGGTGAAAAAGGPGASGVCSAPRRNAASGTTPVDSIGAGFAWSATSFDVSGTDLEGVATQMASAAAVAAAGTNQPARHHRHTFTSGASSARAGGRTASVTGADRAKAASIAWHRLHRAAWASTARASSRGSTPSLQAATVSASMQSGVGPPIDRADSGCNACRSKESSS